MAPPSPPAPRPGQARRRCSPGHPRPRRHPRGGREGTRTGKGPLPFRDRIQKAFGSALDADNIRAYTGEETAKAAAEMGAAADATAGRVARAELRVVSGHSVEHLFAEHRSDFT